MLLVHENKEKFAPWVHDFRVGEDLAQEKSLGKSLGVLIGSKTKTSFENLSPSLATLTKVS